MKTMINIKTDREIKVKAQKVAKEMGLPLGTVINGFLRQFIIAKEVRFSAPYQMTPKLEKILNRVENDIKFGRNISPVFSSAEEMDAYLDNLR